MGYEVLRMSGDHRPGQPVRRTDDERDERRVSAPVVGRTELRVRVLPEVDLEAVRELSVRLSEMARNFEAVRTTLSAFAVSAQQAFESVRAAFPEGLRDTMLWAPDGQDGPESAGEESRTAPDGRSGPRDEVGTDRPADESP
jgi:hypothetical protein